MYCPKCGKENADDAQLCQICGLVLRNVVATGPEQVPKKTSALAVTSLVLGLLSFCTFLLTAPLAVIFGIIALIMIGTSHGRLKGTGMAIAGIAVPIVVVPLMAAILLPALVRVKTIAQREVCSLSMLSLGGAMRVYASDNDGMYPTSSEWCDLLIEHADIGENVFRCAGIVGFIGTDPSTDITSKICHYAMNKNAEKKGVNSPGDMVLLFETEAGWNQSGGPEILSTGNHKDEGCNILFVDGHVEFVKTADLDELKWTAEPED